MKPRRCHFAGRSLSIASLLLLLATAAQAATLLWNNAAGGSWNTAANWSPAQVPGVADDAVITLPGTYTVGATGALSVNSLVLGGGTGAQTLQLTSQTLSLAAASSVAPTGQLNMTNATISGSGTLTNSGTLIIRGTVPSTLNGAFVNAAGAMLRLTSDAANGSGTLTVANGFTNAGAIELTNTVAGFPATLNVTSGTLVNAPTGTISVLAGLGGGPRTMALQLDNQGTVTIGVPTTLALASAAHQNEAGGTINVSGGDLTLNQSGTSPSFTNAGTISVGASRTLTINSGALNMNGGSVTGAGAWAVNNVTASFSAPFTFSTAFTPSSSTLNGPGALTVPVGQTITVFNCTVNAPLTNNGTWIIRGTVPSMQNGTFVNAAGAMLRLTSEPSYPSGTLTVANGFTNAGAIELTNAVAGQPAVLNVTTGTLVNTSSGTISVLAGAGAGPRTMALQLDNQGTVTIGVPTTLALASAAHQNEAGGTINVSGGDLTLTQSGTSPSFTNAGTISVGASRTLTINSGALNMNGGSVTGAGAWAVNNVTASFSAPFTFSTAFTPSSSTLNGPGALTVPVGQTITVFNSTVNAPLTNNGTWIIRGTVPSVQNGTFVNAAGAMLRLTSEPSYPSGTLTVANGFTNAGAIELTNAVAGQPAVLNVTTGSLVNTASGTLSILAGAGAGPRTMALQLDNQGTVTIGVPTTLALASAAHQNEAGGTINVSGGDLTLTQSGTSPSFTNAGTISVGASRTLTINSGALNMNGGSVTGAGAWAVNNVTASFSAPFTFSTAFTPSSSTLNGPGALTVPVGQTITVFNSTVNAPLTNNGTWIIRGTVPSVQNGTFVNAAGAMLRLTSEPSYPSGTLNVANGFTNAGAIELTNTVAGFPATLNVTSGTLVNAPTGTISVLAGLGGGTRTMALQLDNQGTVTIGVPTNLTIASAAHINEAGGTIDLSGGDLGVTQSGTSPSFTNAGTITIPATRTLTFASGTLNMNGGSITGAGTCNLSSVTANVRQSIHHWYDVRVLQFDAERPRGTDPGVGPDDARCSTAR